jgi:hypothetical protein
VAGGWFLLAYRHSGQAFIDKVIGKELVGHMVSDRENAIGVGFALAPGYWFLRFFPWTVLAIMGMAGCVVNVAKTPKERRFERFLFCWIVGGLLLFSLGSHQRGDLPLPLFAPAALLAARVVTRWLSQWEFRRFAWIGGLAFVVFLALHTAYLYRVWARTWEIRHTTAIASLASELADDPTLPPLLHVDSPYALQFHLNTMDRTVSIKDAAAALRADAPCAVTTESASRLRALVGDGTTLYERGTCPGAHEDSIITVLSNRPK